MLRAPPKPRYHQKRGRDADRLMQVEIKRAIGRSLGNIRHEQPQADHRDRQDRHDPVENDSCRRIARTTAAIDIQIPSPELARHARELCRHITHLPNSFLIFSSCRERDDGRTRK